MTDFLEPSSLLFVQRPAPVIPEHRILYKITQVLLILKVASRGEQSSLPRLHLFNWALKDSDRMSKLVTASKTKRLDVLAWGFDPALAHALRYAEADKLIAPRKASFGLSERGDTLAIAVAADPLSFPDAKLFLSTVGKAITENMVETISKGWDY